jgi:hypothetical protein
VLGRAREVTRNGKYTYIEYTRFADDLVILIDAYRRHDWLIGAVDKRLREEFGRLRVEKKVRRQLAHAQKRKDFGWGRWSKPWLYDTFRLFNAYRVRRDGPKVAPAG